MENNNEKQLVLFIKKKEHFNTTELAYKLSEKFENLKNPTTVPFNDKKPNDPLIIFNQGNIQLVINYHTVSFVYKQSDNLTGTVIEIVEFLEDYDIDFNRMGYISTYLHDNKEKNKFLENMFKKPELFKSDFNFSWYTKELIDSVFVNVWDRELTDTYNDVDYVSVFDINTPVDKEYNINSEFLSNFIKKCDKYINGKIKDNIG